MTLLADATHKDKPGLIPAVRRLVRSSELWLVLVAAVIGAGAGALTLGLGLIARFMQGVLFAIQPEVRLSATPGVTPLRLLALPLGGLVLGAVTWAWTRRRPKPAV